MDESLSYSSSRLATPLVKASVDGNVHIYAVKVTHPFSITIESQSTHFPSIPSEKSCWHSHSTTFTYSKITKEFLLLDGPSGPLEVGALSFLTEGKFSPLLH